jgi:hypothetical protein
MYKQYLNSFGEINNHAVLNQISLCIPFDLANTDYQQFKIDVAGGVPLEDSDGNVMTQEQVDDFLRTIP